MKRAILLFAALIPVTLFAQNWSPIRVNQKMNYQHSESEYISHTIWVDTAFLNETDSVYTLNRIVSDIPGDPNHKVKNQPQFLGREITKQENGIYIIGEPFNFNLQTLAGMGDSWTFDLQNNTAEITEISFEEVFGVSDSVKSITISDIMEIKLSKNFGIIYYSDFENPGYYELKGLQNTGFGESIPGFWEIYDFEVGDVFQYHYYHWNTYSGGFQEQYTYKYEITSKAVDSEGYQYNGQGFKSGSWNGGNGNNYYSYPIANQANFIEATNQTIAIYYPNQPFVLYEMYCSFNWGDGITYSRAKIQTDSLGLIYKHYGMELSQFNGHGLFYPIDEGNDTMFVINELIWDCLPEVELGETYKEGLGLTIRYQAGTEEETEWHLEGYIKNGDTVGIITPDSVLFTNIIAQSLILKDVNVYPNPANNYITIKKNSDHFSSNYVIELRDMPGKLVLNKELLRNKERVDVSKLEAGIYFYTIIVNNTIYKTDKIIIN